MKDIQIFDYRFNNLELLQEALTHPSISKKSYERLEFLGDSVLGLVVTEMLLKQFPNESEGDLAKRKAALVVGEILSKIAIIHNLAPIIIMSESERKLGGECNLNTLENVVESLIGAIYLDSNFITIKEIINRIWQPFIDSMHEIPQDPKSKLQEILQKNGLALPKYELIKSEGPQHMLKFTICLKAENFEPVTGEGYSKQQAEKNAAIELLKQMEKQ